jgi:radical SAM superfamily enzyme YgiQ (UPF0313 family)
MKITFVALGSEQLGLSLLSAMCKRMGHEVNLAYSAALFHDRWNLEVPWLAKYFDDRDEVIKTIKETNPDILFFSCLTATYQWMLGVAAEAKQLNPNVKTVFGGVHVSAVPDRVANNKQVDYIVVGEGELALPEILKSIATGKHDGPIDNTWYRNADGTIVKGVQKGFNQELDALPAFDKTLWENHIIVGDRYFTMASRGCPYRCTFCFNNFFAELPEDKKTKGKYVRLRSVDHMMAELIDAKKRYKNIKYIDFQDDVFTTSKAWLKEFLPRYKAEIGLPFQCLTHPKYMDDDIARWMKEAGCMWVQMGVQSMDEDYKNKIKRYERSDHIRSALEYMHKYGLKAKLDHMFGLPGEPIEAQEKALSLYAEFVPARIQTFWTCFLPGTELLKEGMAEGLVSEADAERLNEGLDFYFYRNMSNIKNPEMVSAYAAYEFIFKIMPLLPKFIRLRIKAKHVKWIPELIRKPVAFTADVITGFAHRNPDFEAYAKHYLYQMYWILQRKLRSKAPQISTVNLRERIQPNPIQMQGEVLQ